VLVTGYLRVGTEEGEGLTGGDEHFCRLVREVCLKLVFPHLNCGFVVFFQFSMILSAGFFECLLYARVRYKLLARVTCKMNT